jgi:Uma2 family endonuclease
MATTIPATALDPVHRITVEDFQRMAEVGILAPDDRVELLDGVIVDMSPEGPEHAAAIARISRLLIRRISDDALFVRPQSPLTFGTRSQPEPDLAVVSGNPTDRHPDAALLAIEVSVTSHARDRDVKAPLYAAAGIPEFWLLDLPARTLEVRREPVDGVYRSTRILGPEETVEPLQVPVGPVRVSELLGS